ncbi:MAG: amidohydrolase family protein [Burkholderiaceae bacterium]|nr:amidohydrolase family protein [Burkholderiaceae bacterium]
MFDILIQGGTVHDGSGSEAKPADVAIRADRIVAIGAELGPARQTIDARGCLVTPGFVDVHSHLDGNVTWEHQLKPASGHGITSVVIGNCGVGFAPCRPEHRGFVVALMEGVEDIPASVLDRGLPWDWESYPQYLEFIAGRRFDMNVASLVPHSCLRLWVMGQRAIDGEAATASDIDRIGELAAECLRAGAVGVGSTRLHAQKTLAGISAPTRHAQLDEYLAIGRALAACGGVLQIAPEFNRYPLAEQELDMICTVARQTGCRVTYTLKQTNEFPDAWRAMLERTAQARAEGLDIRPQVLGRPTGAILCWETSTHPFAKCPSYLDLAPMPLDERLVELARPAMRERLVDESRQHGGRFEKLYPRMFAIRGAVRYEPEAREALSVQAEREGRPAAQLVYDAFMADGGRGSVLMTSGNYAEFSLEPALAMMKAEGSLLGLGDAGAHSSIICDASATTSTLTYWCRDRVRGPRLAVPEAVRKLTSEPAEFFGLSGRGRLAVGYHADVNVIDHGRMALDVPRMSHDLPAGGRRLVQAAQGYVATLVNGEVVARQDAFTGALPGRLLTP